MHIGGSGFVELIEEEYSLTPSFETSGVLVASHLRLLTAEAILLATPLPSSGTVYVEI